MSVSAGINLKCPYCGKALYRVVDMKGTNDKENFFGSCYDEGGCNREFAFFVRLEPKCLVLKLERPAVEGKTHE